MSATCTTNTVFQMGKLLIKKYLLELYAHFEGNNLLSFEAKATWVGTTIEQNNKKP